MRPGMGHLIVGAVLLAAGIGVTFVSKEVVWYGAIVVGLIEIGRGAFALIQRRTRSRHIGGNPGGVSGVWALPWLVVGPRR